MKNNNAELIQRTLEGDDAAFVCLVRKYQKRVHALAWRKIGDFHIAEDITQETFLQVYRKLATLKDPSQFPGWLYVIANRRCLAWLRKKRIQTQHVEEIDITMAGSTSYSKYVAAEQAESAAETKRELVKNLLAKLKESDRTVITLYYFGEMTYAEIGEFLGVSVNTIATRVHRARERLKKYEPMIREALGSFQLSPNLTENIMREIPHVKPLPPTGGNASVVPWAIATSTAILIVMMLGISNQYLARFQKPYSFEAQSEPTVEIVEAPIIFDRIAKSALRNQVGRDTTPGKTSRAGTQVSNVTSASVGQLVAARTWTSRTDMPTPRFNFGTCIVGGKVFVIGGDEDKFGDISIPTVEMYDPATDTWERKADMPTARAGVSTVVVDGKIYAIGGGQTKKFQRGLGWVYGGKVLSTIEMYDPVADTWTQKADMPVPRGGSTCVVDGKIYIVGGSAATKKQGRIDNVDVYDPATDTWAAVKSMNHARGVSAVSVIDGKIYVMGGVGWPQIPNHPGPFLSSVEVFDPKNNRWTEIAEMPTPKALHTASVIDGKIYVIGGGFRRGNGLFKYLSTVEVYDPKTDRWTQDPDMPTDRSGHRAEVINGNIYIFGGSNDVFRPLTTVEVYGTVGVPRSVDPIGKLVQTSETLKNSNH